MRAANLTAAVVIMLWLGLAISGRGLMRDALVDDVADWPTLASIDFHIVVPMLMAIALSTLAWLCNSVGRWPLALTLGSIACCGALLAFVLIMGGGV
jgi:hypothetical protein